MLSPDMDIYSECTPLVLPLITAGASSAIALSVGSSLFGNIEFAIGAAGFIGGISGITAYSLQKSGTNNMNHSHDAYYY